MGDMINLDDIIDLVYDGDGESVQVTVAPCERCDCYHAVVDDDPVCRVCRCLESHGELTAYFLERLELYPRMRSDGTYERESREAH